MTIFTIVFMLLAGVFFIVRRREVTDVQKAVIGARMPVGCAVAEGICLLLMAVVVATLDRMGWW